MAVIDILICNNNIQTWTTHNEVYAFTTWGQQAPLQRMEIDLYIKSAKN